MYNIYPYLNDISFLTQLAISPILSSLIKISFLNWQEEVIEQIEGKIISGNINIDGNSSIRRTASLNLILDEKESVENLFFINKKINIEIGYHNNTNKYQNFPILWFPQGIFVITNYSLSHGLSSLTVSLELKDKMCLLNGECGGVLPASTVFDNYETIDENGQYIIKRPTIYQIIKQLVNHFGGEDLTKIIISDLDLKVKQAMSWNSSSPLYILQYQGNQFFFTTNETEYIEETTKENPFYEIQGSPFEQGSNVGFTYVDFTYPGDLIGDAGQSVVDILQQIKETLGNYEYFYDINGNFIFQQVKNFLNNTQSKYILDSLNANKLIPEYLSSMRQSYILDRNDGKSIVDFTKDTKMLISSYSNSPQLGIIKNDFIVWGSKKTSEGAEIPIRYHLAIDKKPQVGNTYQAFKIYDEELGVQVWNIPLSFKTRQDFPEKGIVGFFYLNQSGAEGQNIFKWGQNTEGEYQYICLSGKKMQQITTKDWRTEFYFQGKVAQIYGTETNSYYAELKNEWPKLYNIEPDIGENKRIKKYSQVRVASTSWIANQHIIGKIYYDYELNKVKIGVAGSDGKFSRNEIQNFNIVTPNPNSYQTNNKSFIDIYELIPIGEVKNFSDFKQQVVKYPDQINYYLDFIDSGEKNITKFSIDNIGRRTKVINDGKNSNCVFESYIPDIVLLRILEPATENSQERIESNMQELRNECIARGQAYYQLPAYIYDNLIVGGNQYSCYQSIRQTLHEYLGNNESISLQILPLYFLEPNTCIKVKDEISNIDGNYLINNISFNLGDNSQMSINATKILQKI